MLTDLTFLHPGQPWPPESERARLRRYSDNRKLFENEPDKKWMLQARRISRMLDSAKLESYHIALNFQKLITVKTADLLLGNQPKFESDNSYNELQDIIKRSDLLGRLREVVQDVSMCGDGLLFIRNTSSGPIVDIAAPEIWFPVIDPGDIKSVQYHVLAYAYSTGSGGGKKYWLKAYIHEPGQYTEQLYQLNGDTIGAQQGEDIVHKTGMQDFAVLHIPNMTTSRRYFGIDDYIAVDSLVSEIEVRFAQIAKVLDKHTEPTMQGPSSALVEDDDGNAYFPAGNYISNDVDMNGNHATVGYLTWDAQMEANFNLIDHLVDQIYTQSEMGSAIFGNLDNKAGDIPSGSALRRLMISPLAKVSRIREKLDPAVKKALQLCASCSGKTIDDISIIWRDGLPDDPKESAEIMNIRTAGKPTISQWSAIQSLDDRSSDDVDNELELIRMDDEISSGGMGAALTDKEEDIEE